MSIVFVQTLFAQLALAQLTPSQQWTWGALFLALGASVGSFMNVVVYRLAAGLSVVHPGSRCSICKHPIRLYDNIPVISWFLLRGRCRDCGATFSFRYAAVELIVGGLFLGLFVAEVLYPGQTLPSRDTIAESFLLPWAIVSFHLLLLCTLLCAGLMQLDGHRPPWSLFLLGWAVGAVAPLYWVALRRLPLTAALAGNTWEAGMFEGVAGLAVATLLAGMSQLGWTGFPGKKGQPDKKSNKNKKKKKQPKIAVPTGGYLLQASLVGLFLGWQVAVVVLTISAICLLLADLPARANPAASAAVRSLAMMVATAGTIFAWQPLSQQLPWLLGQDANLMTLTGAAALVLLTAMLNRRMAR